MQRKNLTLGLFGFGCVGFGLYEVLQKTPGLKARIKKIGVKHADKPRKAPAHFFTLNPDEILYDPEINVILELIDDADAAFELVKKAMKQGKAVVSANKKMIAEHFSELLALQKEYDVPFLYEAACCASIPIIRNLEEYYDNDLLESIEGIVNGSTNYILIRTANEPVSYAEALKDAQEKGYAESNPVLDTGGFDAKYKLLILLAHAFGVVCRPDDIVNFGIGNLGDLELNYAREKGLKIKLVAHALKTAEGQVQCLVMPKFVGPGSKLFTVDDVYNGVITKTSFADIQFFVGKGAGAHPTASAVLSDLSALTYSYRYEYKKLHQNIRASLSGDFSVRILLRHPRTLRPLLEPYFSSTEAGFTNREEGYIIGTLTLGLLQELTGLYGAFVSAVLFETVDGNTGEWDESEAEGLLATALSV